MNLQEQISRIQSMMGLENWVKIATPQDLEEKKTHIMRKNITQIMMGFFHIVKLRMLFGEQER